MRLVDIPLSPPSKIKSKKSVYPPLKQKAKKSLSPPKRRTRRSSVYHKGAVSKLSAVSISLEPIVTITNPTQSADSPPVPALRKKVTAKRTAPKSPASTKKLQASAAKKAKSKVTSPAFTGIKSAEETSKKSPISAKKQKKRKLDVSVDNIPTFPLSVTPEAKRAKKSSPSKKSPPKSTRRRNRRISKTPVKVGKTPARSAKTPARSAKTPRHNKSSTSPKNISPTKVVTPAQSDLITVSSQFENQESPKKKSPVKTTKTPRNIAKSPKRKSTKTPAKVTKSPKNDAKSPGKSLTKTPASVTKRKRQNVIEEEVSITPSVKRSRKQTDSVKKGTPVVVLTKTPAKKIKSPEKTSTSKSLKNLKSPTSSNRKIVHKRITSLKETAVVKSPHVKMVTPIGTPNLSAKKRIAQRKSTPARVSKTPMVTNMTPIKMTPRLGGKTFIMKQKLITDKEDFVLRSHVKNGGDVSQTVDHIDSSDKTIYLDSLSTPRAEKDSNMDSVSSPTNDLNTTFGSYSGRSGKCVIL